MGQLPAEVGLRPAAMVENGGGDLPEHYRNYPPRWPNRPLPRRDLEPLVRELLEGVTDEGFRDSEPIRWSYYVVALGRLVDSQRETLARPGIRHNLGRWKREALDTFTRAWDALGPFPITREGGR